MLAGLTRFAHVLRCHGVPVSPAEIIDAAGALETLGVEDRGRVRDALVLTLAKTRDDRETVLACFDAIFAGSLDSLLDADGEDAPLPDAPPDTGTGEMSDLSRAVLSGDWADLGGRLLAGSIDPSGGGPSGSGGSLAARGRLVQGMLEAVGLAGLDRDIARLDAGTPADRAAAARLRAARGRLVAAARDIAARRITLAELRGALVPRLDPSRTPLGALDRLDKRDAAALARRMARRLAAAAGRRRRAARRGRPDVAGMLRFFAASGGDALDLRWTDERPARARLLVLCDVSRSMRATTPFLLAVLSGLGQAGVRFRAFLFSGDVEEVTPTPGAGGRWPDLEGALDRCANQSTDYGTSLRRFEAAAQGWLGPRTSVLVFGDGRGNNLDPGFDALARIRRRCRQVAWFTPERPSLWGTGDSVMDGFARHADHVEHCATLRDLERAIHRMARRMSRSPESERSA